jgi:hypothetical protein
MEQPDEAITRKTALEKELSRDAWWATFSAYANHWLSIISMVIALGCSVAAATLGVFTQTPAKVVGGIAVLPPLIAFVAGNLKFEAKNSWHARRSDGLSKLRSRLLYQLPASPTLEQIAAIARDRDDLETRLQTEWDKTLLLKWAGVFSHRPALHAGDSSDEGK